ncbi:DUF2796 domain-containing protein [Hyphomonas sp.]|uniref:ZrgA family zinc uptake protein n=1 Tax=Hyphomonas sp. TaxID=87 RepID=UPI0025BB3BD1|nr:DUF2796 domain-containing protein [Hyphomonas sp.]
MTFPPVRLPMILLIAGLLAACGRSEPVPPVAAPEPVVAETVEPEAEAHDEHAEGEHHHEDEAAAGGTAHVHGLADLAITREGNKILGELISPMANFGLSETDGAFTDVVTAELSGLIEVEGGDCTAAVPHPMTDNSGEHTDGIVHFVWTCAKPDDVRLVRFSGFTAFPSFETVNTIYITEADQKAGELTPSAPELSLK